MNGAGFRRGGGALGLAAMMWVMAGAGGQAQVPRAGPPVPETAGRDTLPRPSAADSLRVGADSIAVILNLVPGYTVTEYQGESASFRAEEGVFRITGAAEVRREGERVAADTILYRQREEQVEARGNPRVAGRELAELEGRVLFYDVAGRRATALGAETAVTEGGSTWFVEGDVTLHGQTHVYASHARFTTCDLEVPHYHFEASRIKIVRNKVLVAAPAKLYIGRVPVMILPFLVQNLEPGRRSGFLVPRFSVTDIVRTSRGYRREISNLGWYWAVNEYLGAQLTGSWRSGAYTSLLGNVDFHWRRQFLQGNASLQRYWKSGGGRELGVSSQASWRPDERTNVGLSGNYASSSEFIRESTYDPREATRDLRSTLSLSRRFDWGTLALGSEARQSMATGGWNATVPSFALSPNPVTLFSNPNPSLARWYENGTLVWNLSGRHHLMRGQADFFRRLQNGSRTEVQGGIQQLSFGNLSLSATGSLNETLLAEVVGTDSAGGVVGRLAGGRADRAQWNVVAGYQQSLLGQTVFTPNLVLGQEMVRDSLTGGEFLSGQARLAFGANLSTALFGFYPGFGPFQGFRHRLSPTLRYAYSPQVEMTPLQRQVFGESGGFAQNRLSLGLNQTWEAKLKRPTTARAEVPDSLAEGAAEPTEPEKVTLLSISTSPVEYDFVRAARGESGFVTERLSNSLSSDYLGGIAVQVEHELFDRSALDPNERENRGRLGRFAPRLSQVSTGFDLGPNSSLLRWLGSRGSREERRVTSGVLAGADTARLVPTVSPTMTANPLGAGGGDWRASFRYSFSRPPRLYVPEDFQRSGEFRRSQETVQTLDGDVRLALTPHWGMQWGTSYSLTDGEFAGHRLIFQRDLHRWQANFSFYQSPTGNTAFEFTVFLLDNPDLKLEHRERNLGIDRRR